jgi:hypothetical protein
VSSGEELREASRKALAFVTALHHESALGVRDPGVISASEGIREAMASPAESLDLLIALGYMFKASLKAFQTIVDAYDEALTDLGVEGIQSRLGGESAADGILRTVGEAILKSEAGDTHG